MKRKTFDNYDYEEAFPVDLDRDIQKKARKNFEKEHPLQVPDYEEQWKEQQEKLKEWELERLLKEALAQLTPAQRRRVLAYIVGGLSQLQIAARENTTQPAVHHSVRKGLSHLKRILKNFD